MEEERYGSKIHFDHLTLAVPHTVSPTGPRPTSPSSHARTPPSRVPTTTRGRGPPYPSRTQAAPQVPKSWMQEPELPGAPGRFGYVKREHLSVHAPSV